MKQIRSKLKRLAALALAVMLMTSSELSLFGSVFAAETKTGNLYTLLADEYFNSDEKAYNILTSNALYGDVDNISVTYPGETDDLISFVNNKIVAEDFPAEYTNDLTLNWEPVSYTVGTESIDMVGNSADFLGNEGNGEASVQYQLVFTDVDENVLQLPAELMSEAQTQMGVLDKVVADDAPYLGYLQRLDRSTILKIRFALSTGDAFGLLNNNDDKAIATAKSDALYASFFEILTAIWNRCYNELKELNIYRFLVNYTEQGLLYYYTNNEEFQVELDLFAGYLDTLLGEEIWDPNPNATGDEVELTVDDKEYALGKIVDWAVAEGYLSAGTELNFAGLQEKLNAVREELSAPNEAINLESEALEILIKILETGLAEGETISSYEEQPRLRATVSATYCTVTFDGNGGSGSMDSLFVSPGDIVSLPANGFGPAEGKKFKCWSIGGVEYSVGATITVNADVVVAAVWDDIYYRVSFVAGEGTGTMDAAVVIHGGTYSLPECGFTAPEGKQFKCWSVDGTERPVGYELTVTADTVVTAVWETVYCSVRYDAGGGTGSMAGMSVAYGTKITLLENGFVAPEGKQFKCWSIDGTEYAVGDSITVKVDTVVTAVWDDVYYTVSFATGEGTGTMEGKSVIHGGSYTLPENEFIAPEGKKFKCWSVDGIERPVGYELTVTEDTVVTAVWETVYHTVSFDGNGGAGSMDSLSVAYGTSVELPENGFTAPEGKQFKCWSIGGTEYAVGASVVVKADTVVIAVWETVYYTVSFAAGGGTGSITGMSVAHGTEITLPENSFVAPEGKRFKCWSIGGTEYAVGASVAVKADTVVTAVWETVYYNVSFVAGGGTGSMTGMSVAHGTEITLPENGFVAPEGMEFRCWSVNGVECVEGAAYIVTGDTVVTAIWREVNDDAYTIDSISLEDGDGNALAAIPSGSFVVNVAATNWSHDGSALVLVAGYNEQGRLVELKNIALENLSAGDSAEESVSFDNTKETIYQLRVFVVVSFTNPTPLGEMICFPAQ